MSTAVRSVRQEQRQLSAELRARHRTWVQIAVEFRDRYHVTMRAALRMVRDWSQRDAAEQWNRRWPADPKTFKNFSYWELWPAPTGHAPSLDVLARLAELYECSVADLLADGADFRANDPAYRHAQAIAALPTLVGGEGEPNELRPLADALESMDVHELARVATGWANSEEDTPSRRALLLKLSAGLSLAAAAALPADDSAVGEVTATRSGGGCTGIWHSRYSYSSTGRSADLTSDHHVVLRQTSHRIVGDSLPLDTGSELHIELALDASVASGTWREKTSPTGYYQGAVYHGTLQLVVDPTGRRMSSMWIGFGRDFAVNTGRWDLTLVDPSVSKSARRAYSTTA